MILKKYEINFIKEEYTSGIDNVITFSDLDNDGIDEKIIIHDNDFGDASFDLIKSGEEFVDQFNFEGKFPTKFKYIWFKDLNGNGYQEVVLLTQINDSLFINIKEPLLKNGLNRNKIFVDRISSYKSQYEIHANGIWSFDRYQDSLNNLYFSINAGFAGNPRSIYKYDFNKNKITKSPHLTNTSSISELTNLDDDDELEVIVSNYAAQNTLDTLFTKKSDYSSWLIILDDDLNYMFDQIEYKVKSGPIGKSVISDDGTKHVAVLQKTYGDNSFPSQLLKLSHKGEILLTKQLIKSNYGNLINNDNKIYLTDVLNQKCLQFNSNLELIEEYQLDRFYNLKIANVGASKSKEFITIYNNNEVTIYDLNFNHKTQFNLNFKNDKSDPNYEITKDKKGELIIYFQKGSI
ncbi:hypothetical protein [Algibacter mikhailovii]|uniref:hypothetical protein n=1 Tax=Algibacter mikhailovii TaxID=425498 RepID=UPI00249476D4|nr:hypothetical protein [Algibacter mikhailovii]